MAKVNKPNQKSGVNNPESLEYSQWPEKGVATAKSIEWENGEGIDIFLGNTHIELSHQEYDALVAAEQLRQVNYMLKDEHVRWIWRSL
jgi:hypothetical protein